MAQNVSTAVMQRRVEAHDSLDDFPTPPWASRALVEHVIGAGAVRGLTAIDPACNRGFMARPLGEYFGRVHARDIHPYGWSGQEAVEDFLFPGSGPAGGVDWVITNPPFRLGEQFTLTSLASARVGVAMFVRTAFVEGEGRYRRLFSKTPPTVVAHFVERVVIVKGGVLDPDVKIRAIDKKSGKEVWKKPSSATAYSWLVWIRDEAPRPTFWIPPCRRLLTRPGDYEGPA